MIGHFFLTIAITTRVVLFGELHKQSNEFRASIRDKAATDTSFQLFEEDTIWEDESLTSSA